MKTQFLHYKFQLFVQQIVFYYKWIKVRSTSCNFIIPHCTMYFIQIRAVKSKKNLATKITTLGIRIESGEFVFNESFCTRQFSCSSSRRQIEMVKCLTRMVQSCHQRLFLSVERTNHVLFLSTSQMISFKQDNFPNFKQQKK